jgi:hypothetical protein
MLNVTLTLNRVHETIVAAENNKYYMCVHARARDGVRAWVWVRGRV